MLIVIHDSGYAPALTLLPYLIVDTSRVHHLKSCTLTPSPTLEFGDGIVIAWSDGDRDGLHDAKSEMGYTMPSDVSLVHNQ